MSEHASRAGEPAEALEEEVLDQAIEACDGDVRAALRAASSQTPSCWKRLND
jgi:hypothetical protein